VSDIASSREQTPGRSVPQFLHSTVELIKVVIQCFSGRSKGGDKININTYFSQQVLLA
jgi:anti-sigma factor ChrR (cupin superfamily)